MEAVFIQNVEQGHGYIVLLRSESTHKMFSYVKPRYWFKYTLSLSISLVQVHKTFVQ